MPTTPRSSPRVTRLEGATLVLLLLFAASVRVAEALSTPLWFDELYTLAVASRPFGEMLAIARGDVHPPLHFVLVWLWRTAGGDGDLWLRSFSLVCGLGAIAAAWALTRELFGRWAAGITVAMLAISAVHVRISQELRSYPLLWLFVTLAMLGAWRWHARRRTFDAVLFVASAALALWTHYLAGVVLFVLALWGMAAAARDRSRLLRWLGLLVIVALLFAPQLPVWWRQLHRVETDHWLQPPGAAELIDFARHASFGAVYLVPVFSLLAACAFLRPRRRPAAWFALVMGPLIVLLCFVLNLAGVRLFALKYMLFTLPCLFSLAAAGCLQLPWPPLRVVSSGAILAFGLRALLLPHSWEGDDLAHLRAHLAPRLHAGEVVFHADTHTYLFALRYLPEARNRLVRMKPLRYYEGAAVVDPSVYADTAEVHRVASASDAWWGLATDQPATDVHALAVLYDGLANARRFGVFTLWHPHAATDSPAE